MNPIKYLVFVGVFLTFDVSLASERNLTSAEIQTYCQTGQLPQSMHIVRGRDQLNRHCAAIATRDRDSRNSAPLSARPASNPTPSGAAPAEQAAVVPEQSAAAPNAETVTPPTGGVVERSGSCNDPQLTALIPNGQNSTPGLRSGRDTYQADAVRHLLNGNIPPHQRNLVPIQMGANGGTCMGQTGGVTFCAMPEPISIGGSSNFTYPNLGINQSVEVARAMGMILPTSYMIDAIETNAEVEVPSRTRPWFCNTGGDCSASEPYRFQQQSETVSEMVTSQPSYRPGALVSGAYKDYALSHRLTRSGQGFSNLSLYGWNGIQSGRDRAQHDSGHIDYSQVPRFVSQWVQVGNRWELMSNVLADPGCARMLNGGQTIGNNITSAFTNPNLQPPGQTTPVEQGDNTSVMASF